MRLQVQCLASLSELRIWRCLELWCRLQTGLASSVAVAAAQAGGCSSDQTPSLGTSMCCWSGPRKKEKDEYIFKKNSKIKSISRVPASCVAWPNTHTIKPMATVNPSKSISTKVRTVQNQTVREGMTLQISLLLVQGRIRKLKSWFFFVVVLKLMEGVGQLWRK